MMLAMLYLQRGHLWPVAAAAIIVVAVASWWLYAPGSARLARAWRISLLALRALALVVLGMSLLRPVIISSVSEAEPGRVLVLLDASRSMAARDRALESAAGDRRRVIGQLVALADALGRIDGSGRANISATPEGLRQLQLRAEDLVRAGREVDYARLSGRNPKEAQNRLEDAIKAFLADAQAAHDAIGDIKKRPLMSRLLSKLATPPRAEAREEWIRGGVVKAVEEVIAQAEWSQDQLDDELYRGEAQVRKRVDDLSRMSRFELAWEALASEPRGLIPTMRGKAAVSALAMGDTLLPLPLGGASPIEPTAPASDILDQLRASLNRQGAGGLQAVVLFSDGRRVPPDALDLEIPAGTPVFAVNVAAPGVHDLSIAQVELPRSVFAGERFTARVSARAVGIDPAKAAGQVKLTLGASPPLTAPLSAKDKRLEPVEFRDWAMSFDEPGVHRVAVELPVVPGELTAENNRAERWIKVLSQRLRVTAVASSPTWDHRALRDLLQRSTWVELQSALATGEDPVELDPQDLARQDLLVLHDVTPETLSMEQWDAVLELIGTRGGSAIIVPGVMSGATVAPGSPLADLLPYPSRGPDSTYWQTWPGQSPRYHISPSGEGELLDALMLEPTRDANRRRWDELPGFYRFLAIPRLKSDARVLAIERETQLPLLIERRLGAGRVLFLGSAETWRWRAGGRDFDRFWTQLIRYAAGEPYTLSDGVGSLDADPVVANPGDRIRLRARLNQDPRAAPLPEALDLTVMQYGEAVRRVVLSPENPAHHDGRYAGAVADLGEGEYELALSHGATLISLPVRVQRNSEPELADLSGDEAFLRRLAAESGGRFLQLEQVALLPQLLEESRRQRPRFIETRLWDSPWLFAVVIGCLTAEWAMRKRLGLS